MVKAQLLILNNESLRGKLDSGCTQPLLKQASSSKLDLKKSLNHGEYSNIMISKERELSQDFYSQYSY